DEEGDRKGGEEEAQRRQEERRGRIDPELDHHEAQAPDDRDDEGEKQMAERHDRISKPLRHRGRAAWRDGALMKDQDVLRRRRTMTSTPTTSMPGGAAGRSPTLTPLSGMSTSSPSSSRKKW